MRIVLLKTWLTNIGNGFINKGAEICLRKAFPDADIMEFSLFPQYTAIQSGLKNLFRFKYSTMYATPKEQKIVNVLDLFKKVDLIVVSGAILYKNWIPTFTKILQKADNETSVVFLGAGGSPNLEEVGYIKNRLRAIKCRFKALFSRDTETFDYYSDIFDFSYDSIDCGFFVSDWYQPPRCDEEFIVATFDKIKEPKLNTKSKIIRLSHSSLGTPFAGFIREIYSTISCARTNIRRKDNIFFSDSLEDYLFFYANAKEVHSDRVHACVAALSYGVPARLYYSTYRAKLFEKVLGDAGENITKKIVCIDHDKLEKEKMGLINALKELLKFM